MQLIFGWTALSGATDRGVDVRRAPKIWKNPTKTMVLFDDQNHIHLKRCLITTKVTFQALRNGLSGNSTEGFSLLWFWLEVASSSSTMEVVKLPATCKILRFEPPTSEMREKMRFGVTPKRDLGSQFLVPTFWMRGFWVLVLRKMSLWDAKLLHLSQVSLRMAAKVLL